MSDNAIYFPYINVPNTDWFFRVLLYWDRVQSIVPHDYVYDLTKLEPHMKGLVESELVEPLLPMNYVHKIPHFSEAFLRYVDGRIALEASKENNEAFFVSDHMQLLHIEKLQNIAEELQRRGLAIPTRYPWYGVAPWVADAFMAYLAAALGRLEDINADPVTNNAESFLLFNKSAQSKEAVLARKRRSETRQIILSNIFPAPRQTIPLNEIINFKKKHGDVLRGFRGVVEKKCIELAIIEDDVLRQEQITHTLREMQQEMDDIARLFRQRWKHITLGSLVPLLAVATSVGTVSATQEWPALASGVATIGITLAATVYQAFSNKQQREATFKKPLAYATFARQSFVKQKG